MPLALLAVNAAAASDAYTTAADLDSTDMSVPEKFALFKARFNKSYGTRVAKTEQGAFAAFAVNERTIVEHNRQGLSLGR